MCGLNDTARKWFLNKVKLELEKLGSVQSPHDPKLFLYYVSNILHGLLLIHDDDFINTGNKTFEEKVTNAFRQSFLISKHTDTSLKYVGLNIVQKPKYIDVSQVDYIHSLEIVDIPINC